MTTRRVCARPTGRTTSGSSSSSAATTRITSSTSTRTSPRTDLGTDVPIYVDTSDVRDGALAELKWAIEELAAYIGNAQRRMLAYSAFFSDDGRRMTVVHVHPDAASLDDFMTLAGSRFERFAELLALKAIDVYGQPTGRRLAQAPRKGESARRQRGRTTRTARRVQSSRPPVSCRGRRQPGSARDRRHRGGRRLRRCERTREALSPLAAERACRHRSVGGIRE